MSKRSRRSATRTGRRPTVVQPPVPAQVEEQTDFGEYSYVIADLRRVAILAAAMLALLIVLSFFIR